MAVPDLNGFATTAVEYCQQGGFNNPADHGRYGEAMYIPVRDSNVVVYFSGKQTLAHHSYDSGDLKTVVETQVGYESETIDEIPGGYDLALTERNSRIVVLYTVIDSFEDLTTVVSAEYIE